MIASGVSQEIPEREAIAVCGDDLALFEGPSTPGGMKSGSPLEYAPPQQATKQHLPPRGAKPIFLKLYETPKVSWVRDGTPSATYLEKNSKRVLLNGICEPEN
jgi:hypothetical protein